MKKNFLSKLIDNSQSKASEEVRNYIGASSIGSDCLRKIWYQFKGFESAGVLPKTRRTWDIGKNLEGLIGAWLFDAGVAVYLDFQTFHSINVPILQGHIDAYVVIRDKKSILEIKTAKNASFNIFVNKGLKIWNQQYYAQVQSYMGMSHINSAYILVLNKDNSEISDEYVEFDADYYEKLEQKALMISKSESEPPRISGSPLWHTCKMCQFNKVCHNK